MRRLIMAFDFETGEFIFGSGDMRFGSDGHMFHKMGGNMAMDMDTGDLHFVSGWEDEEEDDEW